MSNENSNFGFLNKNKIQLDLKNVNPILNLFYFSYKLKVCFLLIEVATNDVIKLPSLINTLSQKTFVVYVYNTQQPKTKNFLFLIFFIKKSSYLLIGLYNYSYKNYDTILFSLIVSGFDFSLIFTSESNLKNFYKFFFPYFYLFWYSKRINIFL